MSNSRIHSFVAAAACVAVVAFAAGQSAITYPQTRKGDQVDSYGGVTVQDPYRWLEGLETPEVAAWVSAQNAVTSEYLSKLPMRDALKARITRLYDYPRTSLPVLESGRIFYRRNSGLERQSPLYARTGPAGAPEKILDPNSWSADGSISLAAYAPAPGATLLTYQ